MLKKYEIKTFEDAMIFLNALQYNGYDRVTYILELKPEMINVNRSILASYLGLARETVSRMISKYKREVFYERSNSQR